MLRPARLIGSCLSLAGAMTFVLISPEARAQGTTPVPLSKVIVSDEVAKRTLMKTQINAATARAIVDACVEFAHATNSSYSIIVLAPTGDVVDAHIMDGQALTKVLGPQPPGNAPLPGRGAGAPPAGGPPPAGR